MEILCPVALQHSPTPVDLSRVSSTEFPEPSAEGSLRLPNVGVMGVVVTRDVVHRAAQCLWGF